MMSFSIWKLIFHVLIGNDKMSVQQDFDVQLLVVINFIIFLNINYLVQFQNILWYFTDNTSHIVAG